MELSNEILWLAAGVTLIVLEFTLIPAVGFIFAGFAALIVGLLVGVGVLDSVLYQWIAALSLTVILAVVLWNPFTNARKNKHYGQYSDVIGQSATLTENLAPGQIGKAKWSGTTMKARLEDGAVDVMPKDREVIITALDGNVLVVK